MLIILLLQMVSYILDTNIYGRIAVDPDRDELIEHIAKSNTLIHNFALTRQELRNTARTKRLPKGGKVRMALLSIYDRLVARTVIPVDTRITSLAEVCYREYKQRGGGVSKRKIINDFKIVACAALKGCDVIASEDNRTMRDAKALQAYKFVSLRQHLRPPTFIGYRELKQAFTGK